MIAHLFPGQGSQGIGMGRELFDKFPDLVERADGVLGYSIKQLCLGPEDGRLGRTEYTQSALYVVSSLAYAQKLYDTNRRPDFVAGHSLGEYTALFAAEVFDFETGLRLVQKRGELMSRVSGGGMAAVVGLSRDRVDAVLRDHGLDGLDIANLNTSLQVVLSGPQATIAQGKAIFEQAGAQLYSILKVSGAFHSRYMKPVSQEYAEFLRQFEFFEPRIPVIANVEAQPHQTGKVAEWLARQMTEPVRWVASMEYLFELGVEGFVEVGPGTVLTGLLKRIRQTAAQTA